jgi:transketolase
MSNIEKLDLRTAMVEEFISAVERGVNLAVLVADSTSTSKIAPFAEKYPERLINVGIAEQDMVGIATGMALGGFVAVTCNAAPFLISRSNEQVKCDICYSNVNAKLFGLSPGFCYGALGSTHHSIDDISILRGLGNIQIFAPSDPDETREIIKYALEYKGPVYIRMDSITFPSLHPNGCEFKPGKPEVLKQGKDVTICTLGTMAHEALKANIDAEVINCSSIRPLDKSLIIASIKKTKKVITVEEHSINGGLGSVIAEIIAEAGISAKLVRLGVPAGEFAKAGPRAKLWEYYGMDAAGIVNHAKKIHTGS